MTSDYIFYNKETFDITNYVVCRKRDLHLYFNDSDNFIIPTDDDLRVYTNDPFDRKIDPETKKII